MAKANPRRALIKARAIGDPWFKTQALAWVVRYTTDSPTTIAREAEKSADKCADAYKRTAVRSWIVAALAEEGHRRDARRVLRVAIQQSQSILQLSTRAEALMPLLHAAHRIGQHEAETVADELRAHCGRDSHWRCVRAIKDAKSLLDGQLTPREFFW